MNETTPYWIAAWAAVVTAELAWAWFFRAWAVREILRDGACHVFRLV